MLVQLVLLTLTLPGALCVFGVGQRMQTSPLRQTSFCDQVLPLPIGTVHLLENF